MVDLDCQMHMIRHEAKGENAAIETLHTLLEQEVKPKAVQIVKEDTSAIVPAQDHVIYGTGVMNARFPWHTASVPTTLNLSGLPPGFVLVPGISTTC
jgi:hypothetical protein